MQTERIRPEGAYGSSLPTKEVSLAGKKLKANVERRLRPGTAGVFPLRFSRKAIMPVLFFPHIPDEILAVLPGHAIDRKVVLLPFEAARVVSHDRLPLLLRDKMNPKVRTLGQRDHVRGFVAHPVRLIFRTTHRECPRRYPDEIYAQAVRHFAAEFRLWCGRRRFPAIALCHNTNLTIPSFGSPADPFRR